MTTVTEPVQVTVFATAESVDRTARTITGQIVPWDAVGAPMGSPRRMRFRAGSVTVPTDATRVKLLVQHDDWQSVGYLTRHTEHPGGINGTFRIPPGPAGDDALAAAADHRRDGLSVRVEVDEWDDSQPVLEIKASRLREVSLVSVPAFDDARVLSVLATQPGKDPNPMDPNTVAATAPPPEPLPDPDPNEPTPDPADPPTPVQAAGDIDLAGLARLLTPHLSAAFSAPQAPSPAPPRHRAPVTVAAAANVVAEWQRSGGGNPFELSAALNDIVPGNDSGEGLIRPQWLGELWSASQAERPFVDALGTPSRLTGMRAYGWRWVNKPKVATYSGNKTEIPSNPVSTEPAETNAERLAGGWDVDRIYIDLGDPGMVQALFAAATDDYRLKTNAYVGAGLLAEPGTTQVTASSLVEALAKIGAAAGGIGARISFVAVASDLFGSLTSLTRDEVPWWFGSGDQISLGTSSGSVGGMRFWADPSLDAGSVLAGDSRAATFYEQGSTPIRVQAVNIPNGGVDLGVFGYNALIVNDPRAIFTSTVPVVPPGE